MDLVKIVQHMLDAQRLASVLVKRLGAPELRPREQPYRRFETTEEMGPLRVMCSLETISDWKVVLNIQAGGEEEAVKGFTYEASVSYATLDVEYGLVADEDFVSFTLWLDEKDGSLQWSVEIDGWVGAEQFMEFPERLSIDLDADDTNIVLDEPQLDYVIGFIQKLLVA